MKIVLACLCCFFILLSSPMKAQDRPEPPKVLEVAFQDINAENLLVSSIVSVRIADESYCVVASNNAGMESLCFGARSLKLSDATHSGNLVFVTASFDFHARPTNLCLVMLDTRGFAKPDITCTNPVI